MAPRGWVVPGALVALALLPLAATKSARVEWQKPIVVATGAAHRGEWKMNDSDYRWVDDPSPAISGDGATIVAWVDQARKDVLVQRFSRDGKAELAAPANASRSPSTFSWGPRVAVSPTDPKRVFVLWQEIVWSGGTHGGEMQIARSDDGGRTFGAKINLSTSAAGDGKGRLDAETWDNGSLDLAVTPSGEVLVAWTEYEGALWFRRSADGASFAPPVRLGDGKRPARAPSIAASSSVVHVAWTVGDDAGADIHLATSSDGGKSFGAPRVVEDTSGHSDAPRIALDGDGRLHLVHAESAKGRGGPYDLSYRRMTKGVFEPARRIEGARDGHSGSAHFPRVSVAGRRVFLAWERAKSGERPTSIGFTWSADGGDRFAPASNVPGIASPELGVNGGQQGQLANKLAVGGDGAIALVNAPFRANERSEVLLVRGTLR